MFAYFYFSRYDLQITKLRIVLNNYYNTLFVGKVLIPVEETASTNEFACALIRENTAREGTAIFSTNQTTGKGQFGSNWYTGKDQNLAISIILLPTFLKASQFFHLNMAMSLAVAECATHFTGIPSRVKWPNDIYLADKKLAGILIENTISGSNFTSSIVGVGINLNQTQFPDWIPNPISIKDLTQKNVAPESVMQKMCEMIEMRYLQLKNGQFEKIRYDYRAVQYQLGTISLYRSEKTTWAGMITGISPEGKLIVERNGHPKEFGFKEIAYL